MSVVANAVTRMTSGSIGAGVPPGTAARWMVPDAYEFIAQIPRTSTGKFMKTALRERYRHYRWPDA